MVNEFLERQCFREMPSNEVCTTCVHNRSDAGMAAGACPSSANPPKPASRGLFRALADIWTDLFHPVHHPSQQWADNGCDRRATEPGFRSAARTGGRNRRRPRPSRAGRHQACRWRRCCRTARSMFPEMRWRGTACPSSDWPCVTPTTGGGSQAERRQAHFAHFQHGLGRHHTLITSPLGADCWAAQAKGMKDSAPNSRPAADLAGLDGATGAQHTNPPQASGKSRKAVLGQGQVEEQRLHAVGRRRRSAPAFR